MPLLLLPLFPISPKSPQYNLSSFRGTITSVAQADDSTLLHGDSHRAGECSDASLSESQRLLQRIYRAWQALVDECPQCTTTALPLWCRCDSKTTTVQCGTRNSSCITQHGNRLNGRRLLLSFQTFVVLFPCPMLLSCTFAGFPQQMCSLITGIFRFWHTAAAKFLALLWGLTIIILFVRWWKALIECWRWGPFSLKLNSHTV